jgi:hypothetical protein
MKYQNSVPSTAYPTTKLLLYRIAVRLGTVRLGTLQAARLRSGDKEMMDKYASGWQGAGGDATHKRAPPATLADIKAGLEAYDCYLAAVRELDLKLFLSTDKEWSSEEKNSLNPQGQGYDSSAFQNIAIMAWVLTALSNEAAKITVAIHINMKAANAMVERFFSIELSKYALERRQHRDESSGSGKSRSNK